MPTESNQPIIQPNIVVKSWESATKYTKIFTTVEHIVRHSSHWHFACAWTSLYRLQARNFNNDSHPFWLGAWMQGHYVGDESTAGTNRPPAGHGTTTWWNSAVTTHKNMAQNRYIVVFIVISKLPAKTNYSGICLQVGAIGQWNFAGKILISQHLTNNMAATWIANGNSILDKVKIRCCRRESQDHLVSTGMLTVPLLLSYWLALSGHGIVCGNYTVGL